VGRCENIGAMEPAIGRWLQHFLTALPPLEVLNGTFVFLRHGLCIERAEISSFARLRIFLAGIQPVLAGFQFSDHDSIEYSQIKIDSVRFWTVSMNAV
jgi:hypothetical protein